MRGSVSIPRLWYLGRPLTSSSPVMLMSSRTWPSRCVTEPAGRPDRSGRSRFRASSFARARRASSGEHAPRALQHCAARRRSGATADPIGSQDAGLCVVARRHRVGRCDSQRYAPGRDRRSAHHHLRRGRRASPGVPARRARARERRRRRRLADLRDAAERGRGPSRGRLGPRARPPRPVPHVPRHRADRRGDEGEGRGVRSGIEDEGWGKIAQFKVPGAGEMGVYEPRHPSPLPGFARSD